MDTRKKVLIISASARRNSNSDALADSFMEGAKAAGHDVEKVSLADKKIGFCKGCFACLKLGKCIIADDAPEITEMIGNADVIVWATPIYYYEMSGQMKTLLDRMNSLYPSDYRFRKIYLLTTAAEDESHVPEKAVSGLQGWVDCFEKAELAGSLFLGGINNPGEALERKDALNDAYEFGKALE